MAYDDDQQQCVPDDQQTSGEPAAAGAEQSASPAVETAPASDGGAADASVYGDQYGGLDGGASDGGASDGGASASSATDGGAQPDVAQPQPAEPKTGPDCSSQEADVAKARDAEQLASNSTEAAAKKLAITGAGAAAGTLLAGTLTTPVGGAAVGLAGLAAVANAQTDLTRERGGLKVAQGASSRAGDALQQCRNNNAEPDRGSAGNP